LKAREDGGIKWVELLEKFKSVQEKARRVRGHNSHSDEALGLGLGTAQSQDRERPPAVPPKQVSIQPTANQPKAQPLPPGHKPRSSLSNLGRFAGGVAGRKAKR